MRKIERNRLYMLQAVMKVGETHKEKWQSMPEFVNGFASLATYESSMRELIQQKQLLLQPFGGIKAELRSEFSVALGKLGGYLHLIARRNKDKQLALLTEFSISNAKRMSAQKSLALAENVMHFADQYQTELAVIDNAPALVNEAKEQITLFKEKGLIPSERRRLLGETTERIRVLSLEIMDFLKKELDFLMRFFIGVSPIFHEAFQNARVIPKLSGVSQTRSTTVEVDSSQPAANQGGAASTGGGDSAEEDSDSSGQGS